MTQPKCPKCGGESWLDVSGKYQCVKCGHYFKIEVDPLSSPFESNPIIIKEKLLEVKRLLSEDKIEEAHDLYDSVIGYITLHTISTNSEDNKMMDELQHELFEARRLLWKKMAGLEQNPITTAKYKGFCRVCRHDIKVGQRIEYVKGLGCRHIDCLPSREHNPIPVLEAEEEQYEDYWWWPKSEQNPIHIIPHGTKVHYTTVTGQSIFGTIVGGPDKQGYYEIETDEDNYWVWGGRLGKINYEQNPGLLIPILAGAVTGLASGAGFAVVSQAMKAEQNPTKVYTFDEMKKELGSKWYDWSTYFDELCIVCRKNLRSDTNPSAIRRNLCDDSKCMQEVHKIGSEGWTKLYSNRAFVKKEGTYEQNPSRYYPDEASAKQFAEEIKSKGWIILKLELTDHPRYGKKWWVEYGLPRKEPVPRKEIVPVKEPDWPFEGNPTHRIYKCSECGKKFPYTYDGKIKAERHIHAHSVYPGRADEFKCKRCGDIGDHPLDRGMCSSCIEQRNRMKYGTLSEGDNMEQNPKGNPVIAAIVNWMKQNNFVWMDKYTDRMTNCYRYKFWLMSHGKNRGLCKEDRKILLTGVNNIIQTIASDPEKYSIELPINVPYFDIAETLIIKYIQPHKSKVGDNMQQNPTEHLGPVREHLAILKNSLGVKFDDKSLVLELFELITKDLIHLEVEMNPEITLQLGEDIRSALKQIRSLSVPLAGKEQIAMDAYRIIKQASRKGVKELYGQRSIVPLIGEHMEQNPKPIKEIFERLMLKYKYIKEWMDKKWYDQADPMAREFCGLIDSLTYDEQKQFNKLYPDVHGYVVSEVIYGKFKDEEPGKESNPHTQTSVKFDPRMVKLYFCEKCERDLPSGSTHCDQCGGEANWTEMRADEIEMTRIDRERYGRRQLQLMEETGGSWDPYPYSEQNPRQLHPKFQQVREEYLDPEELELRKQIGPMQNPLKDGWYKGNYIVTHPAKKLIKLIKSGADGGEGEFEPFVPKAVAEVAERNDISFVPILKRAGFVEWIPISSTKYGREQNPHSAKFNKYMAEKHTIDAIDDIKGGVITKKEWINQLVSYYGLSKDEAKNLLKSKMKGSGRVQKNPTTSTGLYYPKKGSKEASDKMAKLRAMRGRKKKVR